MQSGILLGLCAYITVNTGMHHLKHLPSLHSRAHGMCGPACFLDYQATCYYVTVQLRKLRRQKSQAGCYNLPQTYKMLNSTLNTSQINIMAGQLRHKPLLSQHPHQFLIGVLDLCCPS